MIYKENDIIENNQYFRKYKHFSIILFQSFNTHLTLIVIKNTIHYNLIDCYFRYISSAWL